MKSDFLRAICANRVYLGKGKMMADGAVLLRGTKIDGIVRQADLAPGIPQDNCGNCTLLPGLIDCHVHLENWMLPLFLGYGVTTVRDAANELRYILRTRASMQQPEAAGPHILCCGPGLDGFPYIHENIFLALETEADAADAVKMLAEQGVDFIKLYAGLREEQVRRAVSESRESGLKTLAHFQGRLNIEDAVRLGVTEIEHLYEVPEKYQPSLIRRILDSGTLVCPTQTVWESALFYLESDDDRQNLLQRVPIGAVRSHLFSYLHGLDRDTLLRVQARQRAYLSALIQAGGEIVAGTDTPCQLALPGISLIDELLLYHACGMSSENAIASATEIPADKFGIPAGRLQKGKRADIIAVRGNPLQQLADLRDTQVVYKAGRRFEAKELRNRDLSLETGGCLPVFHRAADYAEPMRSVYPEFFH